VPAKQKPKPKGRRNLRALPMEEERHEFLDPALEGRPERIGFEESTQLGWRKGGPMRIVIARAKYRTTSNEGTPTLATTSMPPQTFSRCLAAPSRLAKIIVDKCSDGLPLNRQEHCFAREGLDLDHGAMCRWPRRRRHSRQPSASPPTPRASASSPSPRRPGHGSRAGVGTSSSCSPTATT
jgi:transposase